MFTGPGADARTVVARRRAEGLQAESIEAPLFVAVLDGGSRIEFGGAEGGTNLLGTACSPGLVRGVARVIEDPAAGARLGRGES